MEVAKISKEIAVKISGIEYSNNVRFSPIQDADDNWIVSLTEAQYLTDDFEVIKFNPKIEEDGTTTIISS